MNHGIISKGDGNVFSGNAVGEGASVSAGLDGRKSNGESAEGAASWDIGVVTILSEELRALVSELGLERRKEPGGLYFYRGDVAFPGGVARIVATQSHSQGQRSAMAALGNLHREYKPRLCALVGVAGGVHEEQARIGNVVVSTSVVYYENRRVGPGGDVRRRGEHREAPAEIVHAVNAYFVDEGNPARISGQVADRSAEVFEVYSGVIGSGEAVVADRDSEIRAYLTQYNEKILAVDMEAGGMSQFWQENSVSGENNPGWVVVRGISDNADQYKGHQHHDLAARNAAHVFRQLIPYFC
ncbi:hypothetical protein [Streptomyces sp. SM14]|uniref:5'-methylthioadenosine/S-adenosylhomocysteine nucleosidase family protein n=1 Tax=Streptomyces sp. SM14 TaxID=1736045 RepID=UPI00215662EE|nr:hypothetical protein [Streptomyces sp. SM14]